MPRRRGAGPAAPEGATARRASSWPGHRATVAAVEWLIAVTGRDGEMANAAVLKTAGLTTLRVRVPLPAPIPASAPPVAQRTLATPQHSHAGTRRPVVPGGDAGGTVA
jgi:hypothetical protein